MDMPVEIVDSAIETFELAELAARLREGKEYGANGRSAQTLAKAPEMNVVLVVVNDGVALGEHTVPGSVALTVIEGEVDFIAGGAERRVRADTSIVFAGGVAHSVRGVGEAAFLLAITTARA